MGRDAFCAAVSVEIRTSIVPIVFVDAGKLADRALEQFRLRFFPDAPASVKHYSPTSQAGPIDGPGRIIDERNAKIQQLEEQLNLSIADRNRLRAIIDRDAEIKQLWDRQEAELLERIKQLEQAIRRGVTEGPSPSNSGIGGCE